MRPRLMPGTTLLLGLIVLPNLALAASATGTLEGTVRDPLGTPLARATILLGGTNLSAVTGVAGSFAFLNAPVGRFDLEARLSGFGIETRPVEILEGEVTTVDLTLTPVATPLDQIVVSASHSILREEAISTIGLAREEIVKLPHFGDDLYRAVTVLPGMSGGNFSAAFNVRGGFHNEVLARIDGVEIFEPFHLKDFQGVFSILDPQIIASVDVTPGGYPVEFGDRMTGVLEMRTDRPRQLRTNLGISFSNAWVGSAGSFADGRGRWLGSLRRGYLDLVLALAEEGEEEDPGDEDPAPRYWDLFGKIDFDISDSQTFGLKVLAAQDELLFEETEDDEFNDVETSYGNQYLWGAHQGILSSRTFVDTVASWGHVDRDRDAFSEEEFPQEFLEIRDIRDADILNLRQDWTHQAGERHYLKWGFELRGWETEYDYRNEIQLADPIDDPRFLPGDRQTRFRDTYSSEQYAAYVADRVRIGDNLTAELGVRWDEQTLTDEDQVSPRLNLVYDLGGAGVLRAGWGHFYQSQRPHELHVEFGETAFQKAQRAEHWLLGYENELSSGYRVRADAYLRDITDPQVRYETLFDPFNAFPEARIDLVSIPASSASSNGVEISVRAPKRPKVNWWLSYAWSEVEDGAAGRAIKRSIDQTHAVTANFGWHPKPKWQLTWVWTYHTGWPTTPVSGLLRRDEAGEFIVDYTVGEFYSTRLDHYSRLDFRASRTSRLKKGFLTFFVDIQNLLNRDNPRGLDISEFDVVQRPNGDLETIFLEEDWLPILPSFGVSWEF